MRNDTHYTENVTSIKTEALFVALTIIFLALFIWQASARGMFLLSYLLLFLFVFFLFYSLNYRTLIIDLTAESLKLKFGIFNWTVMMENVEGCKLDELPALKKYGGAGIHFMMVHKRYRASFNFLEYPRVVIALRRKVGPVQDISFSTRNPDEVISFISDAAFKAESPKRTDGEFA